MALFLIKIIPFVKDLNFDLLAGKSKINFELQIASFDGQLANYSNPIHLNITSLSCESECILYFDMFHITCLFSWIFMDIQKTQAKIGSSISNSKNSCILSFLHWMTKWFSGLLFFLETILERIFWGYFSTFHWIFLWRKS